MLAPTAQPLGHGFGSPLHYTKGTISGTGRSLADVCIKFVYFSVLRFLKTSQSTIFQSCQDGATASYQPGVGNSKPS